MAQRQASKGRRAALRSIRRARRATAVGDGGSRRGRETESRVKIRAARLREGRQRTKTVSGALCTKSLRARGLGLRSEGLAGTAASRPRQVRGLAGRRRRGRRNALDFCEVVSNRGLVSTLHGQNRC